MTKYVFKKISEKEKKDIRDKVLNHMMAACEAIPKATTERSWNPWEQKPGMEADLQDTGFIMADDLGWKTKTSGFAGS